MGDSKFSGFIKTARSTVSKHSPEILTGFGIAGMITTTVLAVQATPKALRLLEEEQKKKEEPLKIQDKVKTCWKCYIPAFVTGTVSTVCLIGASSVSMKRNAALATAYKLSETALTEYREQVVETIGEKKERTIREEIDKKRIEKNPIEKSSLIVTGNGKTICYDHLSGRYFESSVERIKKAEINLNKNMLNSFVGYASLNEFYDELDLPHITIGDDLGWNSANLIDIRIGSGLTEDDQPCITIDHINPPKYGYDC